MTILDLHVRERIRRIASSFLFAMTIPADRHCEWELKIKQFKMTVINRLLRSQMFIEKIVLFQCATPSGSYKIVNTIFYKHVIRSELIRYFIASLRGTKQSNQLFRYSIIPLFPLARRNDAAYPPLEGAGGGKKQSVKKYMVN